MAVMNMSKHSRTRLHVEGMESRVVPAQFGIAWNDPAHIRISFAPDGTSADGNLTSALNSVLDGQMPRTVWREAIIRAARTWAERGNLNIGIVGDDGSAFGTVGLIQGDPRFGDIRIGAVPMAGDALGQAIPPDPLLSGSYAGDVFFNTNITYTPAMLYSVALHELGHALGMAPSTNTRSVMYNVYGQRQKLDRTDVINLQALYGPKVRDANEGLLGNNRFGRATEIDEPSSYDGATPLVAYGELSSTGDVDYFRFTNDLGQFGPITVRLQTAGLSTMVPRLAIYNQRFQLLNVQYATNIEGSVLTYTIPQSVPGERYYIRIDDTPGGVGNLGRYGLGVTFEALVEPTVLTLDEILQGPYEEVDASDIAELFTDPTTALFNDDDDDDELDDDDDDDDDFRIKDEAIELNPRRIALNRAVYTLTGSLETATDADYFRIRAPHTRHDVPAVLTVYASALGENGITPKITLFDEDEVPIPVDVLANGNGTFTIQAANLEENRRYFLGFENAGVIGNYAVDAVFGTLPADVTTFSEGQLDAASQMDGSFYVARTQLFGFALAVDGTPGTSVTMTIRQNGQTVFTLTANAGETISDVSTFLSPGEYQVTITATGDASYRLRGAVQSDPLGPRPSDSTLAPIYVNPSDPKSYLYPNGQVRLDPFLLALTLIR